MIISLVLTGYVVFLYLKLRAEQEASQPSRQTAFQELEAAAVMIQARIDRLQRIIENRQSGGTT